MSLLDELQSAAALIPPSHVPTASNLPGIVAGLVAQAEFGDKFLAAATGDDSHAAVDALLAGPDSPPATPADPGKVETSPGGPAASPGVPVVAPGAPGTVNPGTGTVTPGTGTVTPGVPAPGGSGAPSPMPPIVAPGSPASDDDANLSEAELQAEIDSLTVRLADKRRATVTSDPPPSSPDPLTPAKLPDHPVKSAGDVNPTSPDSPGSSATRGPDGGLIA